MAPKGHQKDCGCTVCKGKRTKKKKAAPKAKKVIAPVVSDQELRLERCELLINALCTKMGLNPEKLYEHTRKRAKAAATLKE